MNGARFLLSEKLETDGQCFLLENASNVIIHGGAIIGCRDQWDPGTNVAGIRIFGQSQRIRIEGTSIGNLTSNGIGIFGESAESPIRGVIIRDVIVENCCNYYCDYLSEKPGPAPGSDRKDQGGIAMYYVEDWLVDGCRFSGSRSDGTHLYHSHDGRFVNSIVENSRMGGYFLEGCRNVVASASIIRGNGSRGVTIERDSVDCILANSIIEGSGREGLWAPDVQSIIVSSNIFRENGRKDDAQKDCEIRIDNSEQFKTDTSDIQITGNIFYTSEQQTAAIYLGKNVDNISSESNQFHGKAPQQFVEKIEE